MKSRELIALQESLRRVAEATESSDVLPFIPKGNDNPRGWNLLCSVLCDWIEAQRKRSFRAEAD